jgi:hypothetical protein
VLNHLANVRLGQAYAVGYGEENGRDTDAYAQLHKLLSFAHHVLYMSRATECLLLGKI